MEDDVFLRVMEANLLSDMTLQGIETITKVQIFTSLLIYVFFLVYLTNFVKNAIYYICLFFSSLLCNLFDTIFLPSSFSPEGGY